MVLYVLVNKEQIFKNEEKMQDFLKKPIRHAYVYISHINTY